MSRKLLVRTQQTCNSKELRFSRASVAWCSVMGQCTAALASRQLDLSNNDLRTNGIGKMKGKGWSRVNMEDVIRSQYRNNGIWWMVAMLPFGARRNCIGVGTLSFMKFQTHSLSTTTISNGSRCSITTFKYTKGPVNSWPIAMISSSFRVTSYSSTLFSIVWFCSTAFARHWCNSVAQMPRNSTDDAHNAGRYVAMSASIDHKIGAFLNVRRICKSRSMVTLLNSSSGQATPLYITPGDMISTSNDANEVKPSHVLEMSCNQQPKNVN